MLDAECTYTLKEKYINNIQKSRYIYFWGVFLGQCLDNNSAPLRSFETKMLPSEAAFRGATQEIGPKLWILHFYIKNKEMRVKMIFWGVFLGQCLDHNSAPLRSFETKIWPSEAEFRGASRDTGPEVWILDFYIENIEIHAKKSDFLYFFFQKKRMTWKNKSKTWFSKIVWNFQGLIFGPWEVVCAGSRAWKRTKCIKKLKNNVIIFFENFRIFVFRP